MVILWRLVRVLVIMSRAEQSVFMCRSLMRRKMFWMRFVLEGPRWWVSLLSCISISNSCPLLLKCAHSNVISQLILSPLISSAPKQRERGTNIRIGLNLQRKNKLMRTIRPQKVIRQISRPKPNSLQVMFIMIIHHINTIPTTHFFCIHHPNSCFPKQF